MQDRKEEWADFRLAESAPPRLRLIMSVAKVRLRPKSGSDMARPPMPINITGFRPHLSERRPLGITDSINEYGQAR